MNYYEHILEGLREWERIIVNPQKNATVCMLSRFIQLMGEEHFNRDFENYFMGDMEFDEGFIGFHKSMRQVDFFDIGEGHLDMLFWEFIHLSDLPYKTFKTFTEKIKIGVIGDMDDVGDNNKKGWNKFGFFRAI